MNPQDVEIRNATYRLFVELGRAPTPQEAAISSGLDVESLRAAWRRLHGAHALVLDPSGELWMANPFSAVPTPFRVEADRRPWYANCAWDAFGIGAALGVDSRIETRCPDCRESIELEVRANRPEDETLVFHVLVPAVAWWQDIGFT